MRVWVNVGAIITENPRDSDRMVRVLHNIVEIRVVSPNLAECIWQVPGWSRCADPGCHSFRSAISGDNRTDTVPSVT
jgi:hypothetical protein